MREVLRYEHRGQPPISRTQFAHRMLRHGGYAIIIIGVSLAMGMAGYMVFAGESLVDAFLNASMLLGGMGPVGSLDSAPAKVFAGIFALYSGLVLLIVAGVMLAPVFHRVLHRFHWDGEGRLSR